MKHSVFSKHFYYDETSPTLLRWKHDVKAGKGYKIVKAKAGDLAGSISSLGYCVVGLNGKTYKIHRIVWVLLKKMDLSPSQELDHIDGNRLNNKIENLRIVTRKGNARNRKISKRNRSGITGVLRIHDSDNYIAWCGYITCNDGKVVKKCFSIRKYGDDIAFKKACEFRETYLEEINAETSEMYTKRHGSKL